MFNKKNIITIISIVIIIGTGTYFIFKKTQKKPKPPFRTEKPLRKDLVQYVNSSGTLKAKKQITIGSLEAGKVIEILSDNNDPVKENQVLAILDNGVGDSNVKKLEAALDEAKAIVEYQEKFFARQKQLYESNQISKNLYEQYTRDLDVVIAKVKQTEAELQVQKNFYNNLFIKSPRDGIIIAKEIDLGQMVTARLKQRFFL